MNAVQPPVDGARLNADFAAMTDDEFPTITIASAWRRFALLAMCVVAARVVRPCDLSSR